MIAGVLELQMFADMARLSRDMSDARRIVGDSMGHVERSIAAANAAFKAMGVTLSAGAFAALIKGSIDAADGLNDLRKSTSLTIEQLSGLKLAAMQSGGNLQGAADAINKLSKNIGENAEKYRAIGVTAKDPLEAFKQLADVFASIEDPQQRAAFGAEALGKSWASAAPLLSEGGAKLQEMIDKGGELSGMTQQMADDADAFNDALAIMSFHISGVSNAFTAELLKALLPIAEEMSKADSAGQSFAGTLGFGLAESLRTVAVLGSEVAFVFKAVGRDIGAAMAIVERFAAGDIQGALDVKSARQFEAAQQAREQEQSTARIIGASWASAASTAARPDFSTGGVSAAGVSGFIGGGGGKGRVAADSTKDRDAAIMRQFDLAMGSIFADEQIAKEVAAEEKRQQALLDAETKGRAMRWQQATTDLMTRDEQEALAFEGRMTRQQEMLAAELITQEQFEEARAQLVEGYLVRIGNSEAIAAQNRRDFAKKTALDQTAFVLGTMASLSAGAAKHSRTAFEIHKAASIGETAVNAYKAATGAYAALSSIPYVGPALGVAAYGLALASGMASVKAIASTPFGGAGSSPSAPQVPASSGASSFGGGQMGQTFDSQGTPSARVVSAPETRVINIIITGEETYQTVLRLAPALNEAAGNGVIFNIQRG
jgi:hypothetical protein